MSSEPDKVQQILTPGKIAGIVLAILVVVLAAIIVVILVSYGEWREFYNV